MGQVVELVRKVLVHYIRITIVEPNFACPIFIQSLFKFYTKFIQSLYKYYAMFGQKLLNSRTRLVELSDKTCTNLKQESFKSSTKLVQTLGKTYPNLRQDLLNSRTRLVELWALWGKTRWTLGQNVSKPWAKLVQLSNMSRTTGTTRSTLRLL